MNKVTKEEKSQALYVLIALVLLVPFCIFDAYVFTRIWAWFIAGPFHLPLINKAQAYGITFVSIFATKHLATRVVDSKRDFAILKACSEAFVLSLVTWGTGAFMHWFLYN